MLLVAACACLLAILLVGWVLDHRNRQDLAPVAREALLAALPDPVLVLDLAQRVVEANKAAQVLAGVGPGSLGLPLSEWPLLGPALLAQCGAEGDTHLLELDGPSRYFEVKVAFLEQAGMTLGRLLLLRDVTERHLNQLKLTSALLALEDQLETTSNLQCLMREQAIRDPLTGLYNRRYLDEVFGHELARSERDGRPLALVLIDLDHFKRLNDRYGHLAGDEVLRGVAEMLRQAVRESDLVFRFGGEELLLLMPAADAGDALQRSEAIRLQMAEHRFPTGQGPLTVTLSAGMAVWPQHGKCLVSLLDAADKALYAAKHAGRNRVMAV
ncbi:diguanylate cyclase [Chitinimonas naiadis]